MNQKKDLIKTKEIFIESFCMIYATKPFSQITVQEIARKAGYNRSTFYQYFLDVNDLLNYVEEELIDCILKIRKNEGKAHGLLYGLIVAYQMKGLYIDALLGDYGGDHFIKVIKEKIDLSSIDEIADESNSLSPYLVEFRIDTTLSLFRLWLKRDKDISHEEMFKLVTDLYTGGISSIIS